ncbi:hypothetical protein BDR04DRAFT_1229556 [Suillus decipiens]|nr:hypothetical protein BDR04DRAFT_1229556 [Suillus decipiens]
MVTPLQDWGSIDHSNITELRSDIPMKTRGNKKEYRRLNSALDTLLEIKAIATERQVYVPGLAKLIEMYFQTIAQGKHLRQQSLWSKFRKLRDWNGSEDEFKIRCEAVWNLAHQTSCDVHRNIDNSVPPVDIRRRRSLDGLVQAEPDLAQRHNQHGDTPIRPIPPNVGVVAQSSSQNINTTTLQEGTVLHIAELTAAKILEQFRLRDILFGAPLQTINHFNGCIVRPGGRATHTVNFGGSNNRGAGEYIILLCSHVANLALLAVNVGPSRAEVEGNGADDIDDTSDDELLHDSDINATQSNSERHSGPAIPLEAQNNNPSIHPGEQAYDG